MVEISNAAAAAANDDDMDDGTRCSYHPYRSNQGGICALCLQEKLGKLVSSSSPLPLRASSSSSSSSSFRSDFAAGAAASSSAKFGPDNGGHCHDHHAARTRIPFLSKKKKKKQPEVGFRRSKSTTAPARGKFLDPYDGEDYNPKNRGWIWSLFDLSTKSHSNRKIDHSSRDSSKIASLPTAAIAAGTSVKQKEKYAEKSKDFSDTGTAEEYVGGGGGEDSPNSSQATASVSSFERKVSRSRSVGCGSRSFSGDFFERISTGFGDCTLRRVESHREGKPKITPTAIAAVHDRGECLTERVKCGGIFGGFMIQTSSSSSSASSSYWVSSSSGEDGRFPPSTVAPPYGHGHGRNKNRGWAFASPMRAFAKPSSSTSEGKRESTEKNSSTPNLDAIPSLLAVRI